MSDLNLRIGFSTSPAWYSNIIRSVTKSKVSHTFLVAEIAGQDLVFEEGTFGYTVRALAALAKHDTIVAIVKPKHPIDVGFVKSFAELGQLYGYLVLIGMAFVMVGRKLGHRWRNPLKSAHAMICSERNVTVLQDSGYPGAEAFDPSSTSPEDLLEFLTA